MVREGRGMKKVEELRGEVRMRGVGWMMVGSEVKGKAAGPALHLLALLPYRVHNK